MIFPWFKDMFIPSFIKTPVTWCLIYMMLIAYFFTATQSVLMDKQMQNIFSDKLFLQTQGLLYSQFLSSHKSNASSLIKAKADQALHGDRSALRIMGFYALRDPQFFYNYKAPKAGQDDVAKKVWSEKIKELREIISMHPTYEMGFFSYTTDWTRSITYQFVHGGAMHLFGNAFFLLIVGSYLEPVIGGAALLVGFLLTGFLGAMFYTILGGSLSLAPMIGASGSVSGLIGLFGAVFWRQPVRFIYLTLFKRGYCGWIYLPTWIFFLHRVAFDLAGYLSSPPELGASIAFSAHLGGLAMGLILGYILFGWSKATSQGVFSH